MKEQLSAWGAVLLFTFSFTGLDNIADADPHVDHCGIGDVTSISRAAPQGFTQLATGHPLTGLPENLLRCQARLYDDNGPGIPHVWCEQDLFLLGILLFDSYKQLGLDRDTVATFLEQFVTQVSWSSQAETTELEISRTATRDRAGPVFGHLVVFQDYVIMGQQPLSAGGYEWQWTLTHPLFVEPGNPDGIAATATGDVEIVSHQEHVSRVEAGTW